MSAAKQAALRQPAPGPLWPWVKRASWFELALFAALCFFWLVPGFQHETLIFGAAHGIGYARPLLPFLPLTLAGPSKRDPPPNPPPTPRTPKILTPPQEGEA